MTEKLNLMILTDQKELSQFSIAKNSLLKSTGWSWTHHVLDGDLDLAEAKIKEHPFTIVEGESCQKVKQLIQFRSLGSHFLNYVDIIENRGGELWGNSLFTRGFQEVLYNVVKAQGSKGSVVFLGRSPLIYPILEVLAQFGFEDFDLLVVDEKIEQTAAFERMSSSFLKTKITSIHSTALIRSQKEYYLCFVLSDHYSTQIIEDMSYFHFLSTHSFVFDLSAQSNFHFAEVKALGVEVIGFPTIQEHYAKHIIAALENTSRRVE